MAKRNTKKARRQRKEKERRWKINKERKKERKWAEEKERMNAPPQKKQEGSGKRHQKEGKLQK